VCRAPLSDAARSNPTRAREVPPADGGAEPPRELFMHRRGINFSPSRLPLRGAAELARRQSRAAASSFPTFSVVIYNWTRGEKTFRDR